MIEQIVNDALQQEKVSPVPSQQPNHPQQTQQAVPNEQTNIPQTKNSDFIPLNESVIKDLLLEQQKQKIYQNQKQQVQVKQGGGKGYQQGGQYQANRQPRARSRSRDHQRKNSGQKFFPPVFTSISQLKPEKCCQKCSNKSRNGKTCVCVVPADQRKADIARVGCRTCGCTGCSLQDHERKPKSHQQQQRRNDRHDHRDKEVMKNGCCKRCMKAFSKMRKSCLCQVPLRCRNKPLPVNGCDFCGCHGCNPEDVGHQRRRNSPSYSPRRKRSNDQQQLLLFSIILILGKSRKEDMNFYNLKNTSYPFIISPPLTSYSFKRSWTHSQASAKG